MKLRKRFILIFSILGLMGLLGGCGMFGKPSLTKEQQDNVVKRIARGYEIESIEFTGFSRDKVTGTYHLLFIINDEEKYKTGISTRDLKRFENSTDEVGLSPIDLFQELERENVLSIDAVDLNKIEIIYLEE